MAKKKRVPGVISPYLYGDPMSLHLFFLLAGCFLASPGALTKALHHREQSDPLAFQWIEDTYKVGKKSHQLGCPPPSQDAGSWQMIVDFRIPGPKHIIILVVTVTGQGAISKSSVINWSDMGSKFNPSEKPIIIRPFGPHFYPCL